MQKRKVPLGYALAQFGITAVVLLLTAALSAYVIEIVASPVGASALARAILSWSYPVRFAVFTAYFIAAFTVLWLFQQRRAAGLRRQARIQDIQGK